MDRCKKIFEESRLTLHSNLTDDSLRENFDSDYLAAKRQIVSLWQSLKNSTVTVGTETKKNFHHDWTLLANYTWNGGTLKTFSAIPPGAFWGLGFGSVQGEDGLWRDRVGGATYNWNSDVDEMFIYAIFPKSQFQTNFDAGYGQLRLLPGDSGSIILAAGLPMGVLATVDGEKTSGGASIMPLPEATSEEDNRTSSKDPVVSGGAPANSTMGCMHDFKIGS